MQYILTHTLTAFRRPDLHSTILKNRYKQKYTQLYRIEKMDSFWTELNFRKSRSLSHIDVIHIYFMNAKGYLFVQVHQNCVVGCIIIGERTHIHGIEAFARQFDRFQFHSHFLGKLNFLSHLKKNKLERHFLGFSTHNKPYCHTHNIRYKCVPAIVESASNADNGSRSLTMPECSFSIHFHTYLHSVASFRQNAVLRCGLCSQKATKKRSNMKLKFICIFYSHFHSQAICDKS